MVEYLTRDRGVAGLSLTGVTALWALSKTHLFLASKVTVDSGVPQGTVLRPLLFLRHIYDLPLAVSSQVRLFADDCLLYRTIKSQEDHTILQQDLIELEKGASKWGMRFNVKK